MLCSDTFASGEAPFLISAKVCRFLFELMCCPERAAWFCMGPNEAFDCTCCTILLTAL